MRHKILEEVWRARDGLSAECGHDVRRLFERLKALEARHPDRVLSFAPGRNTKPVRRKSDASNARTRSGKRFVAKAAT